MVLENKEPGVVANLFGTDVGIARLAEEKTWKNIRLAAFDLECTDFFSCN